MNKILYWKNRMAGKRGQGEYPKLDKVDEERTTFMPSYRKMYREKIRNHKYTRKLRKGDAPHVINDYSFQVERPDHKLNNHTRLLQRRYERRRELVGQSDPKTVINKETK